MHLSDTKDSVNKGTHILESVHSNTRVFSMQL